MAATSVREQGYYRAVTRSAIADLPGWLTTALTPPPPPPPSAPVLLPRQRVGAYLHKILDEETRTLAVAPVGTRHTAQLAAARTLGRLVGGGVLAEDEARALLLAAAAGHVGVQNTTRVEVERDITDGLAYGARLPRRIESTR